MIELLLFYLRHGYLSATECLVFLWLKELADESGCGNVHLTNLANDLGRSRSRCQGYLKRLERHGLIETLRHRGSECKVYRLEKAVIDAARNRSRPRPASVFGP